MNQWRRRTAKETTAHTSAARELDGMRVEMGTQGVGEVAAVIPPIDDIVESLTY